LAGSPAWTWQEFHWQEFQALPAETVTVDVHCVTRWSKLDPEWRGVSVDTLLGQGEHDAPHVTKYPECRVADLTGRSM
jgi:DMSO/TMAO reductase YedYZ molybdopterin-dependent catalytic subunit